MIKIDSSLLRNVEKCVALAGYYLADSVFSGIAYANRTLAEEEALATAALVNLDRDLTEVLIYEGGLLKDCRVVHFGAQFPVERKVSSEEVNNLISVLGSLDGAKNLKGIVVTGDSDMSEKVIEAMEQLLSYPVRYGSCMPKPGEELPLDRMGYVGCLGVLDHIRQQEDLKNMGGSFFTRIYNKVISFADEYF
jgi:cell division ATPase FtsA